MNCSLAKRISAIITLILCCVWLFKKNNLVEFKTSCSISSNQIDWRTIDSDQLTPVQMFDYFLWQNRTACRWIQDFGGVVYHNPYALDGQKAICLDPFVAPPERNCLVYSFGINNEWSFDEAMDSYGCQVFAFDPSMKKKDHDHRPNIHFFNIGLSSVNSTNDKGWRLLTLSSIYDMFKSRHGDRVIDYLKVDIEFDEWTVIPQMIQSGMLDKIRQMGFEIHLPEIDSLEMFKKYVNIVRSIENNGMIRFDSKQNPWFNVNFTKLNASGTGGYEIAWYNDKFTRRPS